MHSILNSDQFKAIMTMLTIAYPNFKFDHNNSLQVDVWYGSLSDLEPNKLALAIKSVISTSEFAPTIATIRKKYAEMNIADKVDNEEAWGLVIKAISNYGYMRADEAMTSLPKQVAKAVMWVGGFKMICESENVDVIRGQFNKAMASVNNREHTNKILGDSLLTQIENHTVKEGHRPQLQLETTYNITRREQDQETLDSMANVRDVLRRVCG